ncbi:MAG: endonuclease [Saprospiraceae bacterium]
MNKLFFFILSLAVLATFFSCKIKKTPTEVITQKDFRIGFYNVENLFDTIDIDGKADEEFTPESKKKWNTERYFKKLNDLAKVVDGMNYPAILGLCEVENATVLKDFTTETSLKNHDYNYVHFESPDFRGIDVAMIYQKSIFQVLDSETIEINFPKSIIGEEKYTTREILHVKGIFAKKDTLHLYINHFPSRRGGLKASEPKRIYVAEQLMNSVNNVLSKNKNANILLMGDFNDEPDNNSITKTIGAKNLPVDDSETSLINCAAEQDMMKKGTYNFRGNWNMLDQIIISNSMLQTGGKLKIGEFQIFQKEWMMYKSDKYGLTPNRTYGGPNYYGGFSDHLPVYVEIRVD